MLTQAIRRHCCLILHEMEAHEKTGDLIKRRW